MLKYFLRFYIWYRNLFDTYWGFPVLLASLTFDICIYFDDIKFSFPFFIQDSNVLLQCLKSMFSNKIFAKKNLAINLMLPNDLVQGVKGLLWYLSQRSSQSLFLDGMYEKRSFKCINKNLIIVKRNAVFNVYHIWLTHTDLFSFIVVIPIFDVQLFVNKLKIGEK